MFCALDHPCLKNLNTYLYNSPVLFISESAQFALHSITLYQTCDDQYQFLMRKTQDIQCTLSHDHSSKA